MSYKEIWNWVLSCATGISRGKFETKQFDGTDAADIQRVLGGPDMLGLSVCDSFSPNLQTVVQAVEKSGADVLIFDHLQHIQAPAGETRAAIAEFVKGLKQLAAERNIAVLAAAQLARPMKIIDYQTKAVTEARPVLSDVAECGKIEQEATVVALMYKKGESVDEGTPIVTFEIAKNRFGKNEALFDLAFDTERTKFSLLGG